MATAIFLRGLKKGKTAMFRIHEAINKEIALLILEGKFYKLSNLLNV